MDHLRGPEAVDLSQWRLGDFNSLRGDKIYDRRRFAQLHGSRRGRPDRDLQRVFDARFAAVCAARLDALIDFRIRLLVDVKPGIVFGESGKQFRRSQEMVSSEFVHDPRHVFDDRRFPTVKTYKRRKQTHLFRSLIDLFDARPACQKMESRDRIDHENAIRNEAGNVLGLDGIAA